MEKGQIIGLTGYLGVVAAYMAMVSYGVLTPLDQYKFLDYTPAQIVALALFAVGIGIVIASIKAAGSRDIKDYVAASSQMAQQFFGVSEKQINRFAKQVGKDLEQRVDPQGKIRGLVGKAKDTLGLLGAKVSRVVKDKLGMATNPKYPTPAQFASDLRGAYVVRQVVAASQVATGTAADQLYLRQVPVILARPANVALAEPEGQFVKRRAQYIYLIIIFVAIGIFLWWLFGR